MHQFTVNGVNYLLQPESHDYASGTRYFWTFDNLPDGQYQALFDFSDGDATANETLNFSVGPAGCSTSGDINGDGVLDVIDIVITVNNILSCETIQPPCYDLCADMNNDDVLDVLDVVLMVDSILNPSAG